MKVTALTNTFEGSPEIKGWCPGALRPMLSGDGWVVRVRPPAGRLTQEQAACIADAARRFGNGLLDISSRANIQIRGVQKNEHGALIALLRDCQLIDPTPAAESQRNVMLTPFADDTDLALAQSLEAALTDQAAPRLPGKFGFAIDTGPVPVLQSAPADIRVERGASGDLLLCADGSDLGKPVASNTLIHEALELAEYFARCGGVKDGRGRMHRFVAHNTLPDGFTTPRQKSARPALPGFFPHGALVGLAFGQMGSETLAGLAALGPLRLTPWRMILIEGMTTFPDLPGLIITPDDPLLRVVACTGAPGCAQALGETRQLARRLAPMVPQDTQLHVSGCTKGCAHPRAAALTLVANDTGYDLIRAGNATAEPERRNLTQDKIERAF